MRLKRMNITIPQELAQQLDQLTGPRKKSQFISEALRDRIEGIQHHKTQKALEEGYNARREEATSLTKEFQAADLEGWDEY